jgi:hypothetical protein
MLTKRFLMVVISAVMAIALCFVLTEHLSKPRDTGDLNTQDGQVLFEQLTEALQQNEALDTAEEFKHLENSGV